MTCTSCDGSLPSDARFCPSCGTPSAQVVVAEERKLVTVIFCDLVGSTPLAEKLDPETLRSVMLRYFAAMRGPIEALGGTVEKFIGDAVMAVFGVPVMREDDAGRAAAAALGMLDALETLNAQLEATLGVRLNVRIGVHSGPAVTSTDVSTRQSLVSGDTVNIAARLEQNATAGQILIGPLTRDAIGLGARVEPVGPLALKGKSEPLTAYALLGLDDDEPDRLRRFDLSFVGREDELAALDAALSAVAAEVRPQRRAVCGEPGIGKTRLVREWLDRIDVPVAHGEGRCRPFGTTGSLAPLADAIGKILVGASGSPPEPLAVLEAGLLLDGTPGPSIDGTCAALVRVLGALSTERPVVLTIDDCQWAGPLLLDVVERLARTPACGAVLFVCIARLDLLDERPDWAAGRSEPIVLSGLSPLDSGLLAAQFVEVEAHHTVATERILEMAGGNPFHLEQLFASLEEVGGELPHTLQSLLGARIDSLDRADRVTLDLAAVFGREFEPDLVTALAESGPEAGPGGPLESLLESGDPVRAALSRLHRRRLVDPGDAVSSSAEQTRFSNGLLHEATYRAMAKRTRAERHERAATVLSRGGVAAAEHMEQAYRLRNALGLGDEATETLRRRASGLLAAAGEQALIRSDLGWAETLLDRAVELAKDGEAGWARAARQLGEVRIATGHADAGRTLLRTVLESAPEPVETAHAKLALAVADETAPASVAALAAHLLPVFEAAGDELGLARVRVRMAQERQLHGRHADAAELLDRGLAHALRGQAEPELALALGAIGVSLWRGPAPAAAAVDQCRRLLAEYGTTRPVVRVTLSCPLAVLLALGEQWADARSCLKQAAQTAAELGYAEGRVVIPIFAATVESLAGNSDGALELLEAGAAEARRLGATGLLSAITRDIARQLLDAGLVAEAAQRLELIGDGADLLGSDAADLDGIRSRLAAAHGRFGLAAELAERAYAAASATDSPLVRAVAALDQAMSLRMASCPGPASDAAGVAYELFAAKGHRPGMRQAAEVRLAAAWEAGRITGTAALPSEGSKE